MLSLQVSDIDNHATSTWKKWFPEIWPLGFLYYFKCWFNRIISIVVLWFITFLLSLWILFSSRTCKQLAENFFPYVYFWTAKWRTYDHILWLPFKSFKISVRVYMRWRWKCNFLGESWASYSSIICTVLFIAVVQMSWHRWWASRSCSTTMKQHMVRVSEIVFSVWL